MGPCRIENVVGVSEWGRCAHGRWKSVLTHHRTQVRICRRLLIHRGGAQIRIQRCIKVQCAAMGHPDDRTMVDRLMFGQEIVMTAQFLALSMINFQKTKIDTHLIFSSSVYPSQHETGSLQIPINNNTGSLPDLTCFHFPSPLPTPLDQDPDNTVSCVFCWFVNFEVYFDSRARKDRLPNQHRVDGFPSTIGRRKFEFPAHTHRLILMKPDWL